MRKIKHNFLLLLILVFNTSLTQAQQTDSDIQNQHIQKFIQIWGLVKYKSRESITGKLDADKVFLDLVARIKNSDEKQFNQMMLEFIPPVDLSLNAANHNYERAKLDRRQHLLKNTDYGWINNRSYNAALKQKLTDLSNQINITGKHQYVPTVWYEGDIPNEASYKTYAFNQEGMNLLALAKAWNAVEYLFPYKYRTDKEWKQVLEEMVPIFMKINDRTSYEKSILTLAVDLNDTHGAAFMENEMKMISTIFKVRYYPPFNYKADAKGIIIKKFLNDSLFKNSELQHGDRIVAINGVKIGKWLKERAILIPASNDAVKYRDLSSVDYNSGNTFAFSNLESETLSVKVRRESSYLNLKLVLLDRRNKQHIKIIEQYIVSKREQDKNIKGREDLSGDIALFRAGHFFEKDLPGDKDLEKLSAELKSKKAIIFDMRGYPQAPGLFTYYLPLVLGKGPFVFARYYAVDLKDPGTFKYREGLENYMYVAKDGPKSMGELYTGKIVILTDENTQSMGEWFTMMLSQLNANTKIIGSQTAGADGDVKRIVLPGDYRFSFTGNGIFYPDGRETQRIGIIPDIYFKPSAKDLSTEKDAQLERAIKYIREGK